MKYLIIPDVHNRVGWAENLITRLRPAVDSVVFLGDYFDSLHDGPEIAFATAEWLRWSVHQSGRIHLMGNHDIPYRWSRYVCPCPGYTQAKHQAISGGGKPMGKAEWSAIGVAHILHRTWEARPVVLSHAGFTLANLYGVPDFRDVAQGGQCAHLRKLLPQEHLNHIREQAEKCVRRADARALNDNPHPHYWFRRGTRVDDRNVGGPFWLDRHQFHSPVPGIDQVVGHTRVRKPQRHYVPPKEAPDSEVWFIDGAGLYAAILDISVVTSTGGYLVTPIHAQGERIGEPCDL